MTENKTVGGVNTDEKSASSNSSTPKNWFSDRLLISAVAIFLLVILFFIGFSGSGKLNLQKILKQQELEKKQQVQTTAPDFGDTSKLFKSDIDRQRFDQFIDSSEYGKAFIFLSGEYSGSLSNDKREVLIKIADFIKANLSDQAKDTDLTIPCREETCGAVFAYSEKLIELKNTVKDDISLEKLLKDELLHNIENASLAAGEGNQILEFNSLLNVFFKLRKEWQASGNEEFKNLAQKTLLVLEQVHKELYEFAKEKGQLNL